MGIKSKYSVENPAYSIRPGLTFVFSHPAHMIALFFGVGLFRPGPGTWGTLAGVLVWAGLVHCFDWRALVAIILFGFVLGTWASQKTSDDLGVQDPGCIVIDEVIAVWLVCLLLPQNIVSWCAAFIAFRVFDIVKLPPASWVDEKVHNGFGGMLDDVLAAFWAVVVLLLIDYLCAQCFENSWRFLGIFS